MAKKRRGKQALSSLVVAHIRKQVKKLGLQPGGLLGTEGEIANRLGVSPRVVRDATQQMRACGMLHAKPGVGLIVGQADPVAAFARILPMR